MVKNTNEAFGDTICFDSVEDGLAAMAPQMDRWVQEWADLAEMYPSVEECAALRAEMATEFVRGLVAC